MPLLAETERKGAEMGEERLQRLTLEAEERNARKLQKQRTLCTIDIKPCEVLSDADLMDLWKKITSLATQDGLVWGESCVLEPVAFGIKKIVCSFTMGVDNSSDDIIEAIESLDDDVQSAEITSMNMI